MKPEYDLFALKNKCWQNFTGKRQRKGWYLNTNHFTFQKSYLILLFTQNISNNIIPEQWSIRKIVVHKAEEEEDNIQIDFMIIFLLKTIIEEKVEELF